MTKYFLKELRIEGFRGINNDGEPLLLKFDPEKVNSIFAQNGTGKSSIYEALQYCLTGEVAKLSQLQASENPAEHTANLFHSSGGESTVSLTLEPDDGQRRTRVVVHRSASGLRTVTSPTGHATPDELLRSLASEFTLLDYTTFQEFISASALERGRTFAPLLGLSKYSNLRRGLQAVSDNRNLNSDFELPVLKERLTFLNRQKSEEFSKVARYAEQLTGDQPTDTSALDATASSIVDALHQVELLQPIFAAATKLEDVPFDRLREKIADAEGGPEREQRSQLSAEQLSFDALGVAPGTDAFEDAQQAVRALADVLTGTPGPKTQQLFRCAHDVLESDEWEDPTMCPLCGSSLDASLDARVAEVLREYEAARAAAENLRRAMQQGPWASRLRVLEGSPLNARSSNFYQDLQSKASATELRVDDLEQANKRLIELESALTSRRDEVSARIDELDAAVPASLVQLTVQVDRALAAKQSIEKLRSLTREESDLQRRVDLYSRWAKYIKQLSRDFGLAEQGLATSVLDDIQDNYRSMFTTVMGLGDVTPSLTRDDGENLDLSLEDFHGRKEVSARAVLSESARNAFSISVYLSAAKLRSDAGGFVVLDDITSSFDAGNQLNLMEYIRTTLQRTDTRPGFQFILLSHDVLLEKYFDRLSSSPDWRHIRLSGHPPMAPLTASDQSADRLRQQTIRFAQAGQLEVASSTLRQYLEFVLTQIIRRLRVPVPIDLAMNESKVMVQTCVDSIESALDLRVKAGETLSLTTDQQRDVKNTHVPAIVGNIMSHYNTGGAGHFSPSAILGVVQKIDDFEKCFKQEDPAGSGHYRWYKSLTER